MYRERDKLSLVQIKVRSKPSAPIFLLPHVLATIFFVATCVTPLNPCVERGPVYRERRSQDRVAEPLEQSELLTPLGSGGS